MINKLLEYLTSYFTPKENKNISLISLYDQLEALMKLNCPKSLYFIYRNKDRIHQILYDSDLNLKLPPTLADKGVYNLFYIVLLIKANAEIINYTYDLVFIKIVNDLKSIKNKSKKDTLTIFVFSLILIQLIDNYKLTDIYCEEDDSSDLNKVYDECIKTKNEFKNTFLKSMNLNINDIYIDNINLEEIYIEIIKSLINNKELENYEHCSYILGQIELDKIDLTEKMFQDLKNVFNDEKNNEYLNEFNIKEVDDLFDEKKLDFYLTIFNYILKESIYIYNFDFLLRARNEILKIIKSESNIKLSQYLYNNDDSINNKRIKEKLNIILNKFCDNDYYINNYLNNTYKQLSEILQYYKDFYFYQKKQEIINIENYLNNKLTLSKEETNKYLQDYTQAEKLKQLRDIIYYFFWVKNPEYFDKERKLKEKNEKAQKEIINYIKKVETCAKMFADDKYETKMRKDDRIIIYNYYNDDEINEKEKSQIIPDKKKFMEDTKSMVPQKSNWDKIDNNINLNENNFSNNMNDIMINEETDSTETKKSNNLLSYKQTKKVQNIIQAEIGEFVCIEGESDNESKIIELIELYLNTNENNNTSKNESDKPTEGEEEKVIEEVEFMKINNNEISKIKIDKNKKAIKQKDSIKLNGLTPKSCLYLDNTNQIIFCQEGAYHYQNLFGDIQSMDKKKISDDNCIGGIKLNKNLIVFTSHIDTHKVNDTDKISFYNPNTKEIIKEIEGYYINNTINDFGLGILTPSKNDIKDNNNKILLCACKNNEAKNGILLINIDNIEKYKGDNDEKIIKFIETGTFEAYTFCQLKMKNDTQTDYFLIGGYNEEIEKGEVKLYKNISDKNKNELEIKLITTLDLKNNNNSEFNENGIINYIIQYKNNKNVIICSDKNMHIFSEPDFGFDEELISNDENEVIDWTFLDHIEIPDTK